MSEHGDQARPWWASDADADPRPDAAEDPLEQHRAARRGDAAPDAAVWLDAAVAGVVDLAERVAEAAREHRDAAPADDGSEGEPAADHDVCGVCPICVGLRTLRVSRPELADHLTLAARHLAAAVRELIEDPPPRSRGRDEDPPDELERIDLQ